MCWKFVLVTNGKKSSEENTQKTSKIWSSDVKESLQDYQTLQNEYRKKEVDIFIRPKKIIEHNGTYNHADPRKYKSDDLIREHGKLIKASEIWEREKMILKQIKKKGYKILVIWENDLLQDTENTTKKILKFAKL